MVLKITVGAFVFHDGNVLLVRQVGSDKWAPPGGHLEEDETIGESLMREMREEVNLSPRFVMSTNDVSIEDWTPEPVPFAVWRKPSKRGGFGTLLHFAGVVDDVSGLRIQESEIAEARWFNIANIDANLEVRPVMRARVHRAYAFVREHGLLK